MDKKPREVELQSRVMEWGMKKSEVNEELGEKLPGF